jgi:hypothetical protein
VAAGEAVVSICYGPTATVAVLAGADGAWAPVRADGAARLSSSVFLAPDGRWLAGAAAWQAGLTQPGRFVTEPVQWLRAESVAVDGVAADPVDMVAATVRRLMADAAARLGGDPVSGVRLVVPAGWGPRRRAPLLEAVKRAGLPTSTLVEAPVAVAEHLAATGVRLLVGAFVAVCDMDWGEVSVLRRTPHGFQVLSTIDAPEVGERVVDEQLAAWLAAPVPTADQPPAAVDAPVVPPDGVGLSTRLDVHNAREALTTAAAVTVGPPGGPRAVLHAGWLTQAAEPVAKRAGQTLVKAVEAAELRPDQLAGVWVCGALAATPQLPDMVSAHAGTPVAAVPDPVYGAARGAANTVGPPADPTADTAGQPPPPGWGRVWSVGLPVLASILLFVQFFATVTRSGTTSDNLRTGYLIANWAELALAALFALLGFLDSATVIASSIPPRDPLTPPPAGRRFDNQQIGTAILAATAVGFAVAALYAAFAAIRAAWPIGPFLQWTLIPLLPIGALMAAAAGLATRPGRAPAGGWHRWLRSPIGSILLATLGMLLIQFGLTLPISQAQELAANVVVIVGGLLFGVSIAWALASRTVYRLIIAVPAAIGTAIVVSAATTTILAIGYLAVVAFWWARRVWDLASRPAGALLRPR